jgi:microcystin-dependent protein
MTQPFLGEIRPFGCNFAPSGWALCNGQILAITQNTALFSLLGTNYGGNGTTTFGLPNLQSRVPMFWGQGPGLTQRSIGEMGGTETVTLLTSQLTAHTHGGNVWVGRGGTASAAPTVNGALTASQGGNEYDTAVPGSPAVMDPSSVSVVGGSQPHNNLMPYLVINWCIALQGIFPARS